MDNKKAIIKEFLEWVYCILIAVALALLIRYFVGTPTIVRQKSMHPTLKQDERLILNRITKTFNKMPERGDIITFEAPNTEAVVGVKAVYTNQPEDIFSKFAYYVLEINKTSFIKRVIGLPGDRITLQDGKVYLNGEELKEDYLQPSVVTQPQNVYLTDFEVPEGYIFAMGDNRSGSLDCRQFGCIPLEKLEGTVWIRFWPFDVFGEVDN